MPLQTNNLGILFSQQESPSDTNTHLTAIIRLTYTVNSDVPSSIRHPELPPPRSLAGANNSKSLPVSRDAIHLLSPPPPPGIIGLGKEGPIHKLSSSCVAMVTSSSTNEYVLSKVRPTDTCVPKTTGCVALLCDWVRCGTCQFPYPACHSLLPSVVGAGGSAAQWSRKCKRKLGRRLPRTPRGRPRVVYIRPFTLYKSAICRRRGLALPLKLGARRVSAFV